MKTGHLHELIGPPRSREFHHRPLETNIPENRFNTVIQRTITIPQQHMQILHTSYPNATAPPLPISALCPALWPGSSTHRTLLVPNFHPNLQKPSADGPEAFVILVISRIWAFSVGQSYLRPAFGPNSAQNELLKPWRFNESTDSGRVHELAAVTATQVPVAHAARWALHGRRR